MTRKRFSCVGITILLFFLLVQPVWALTVPTHPAAAALPRESFTYDAVGNRVASHLSSTHVYDAANRLLEDSGFTYTYDANGNLITKTEKATGAVTT